MSLLLFLAAYGVLVADPRKRHEEQMAAIRGLEPLPPPTVIKPAAPKPPVFLEDEFDAWLDQWDKNAEYRVEGDASVIPHGMPVPPRFKALYDQYVEKGWIEFEGYYEAPTVQF